MQVQVPSLAGFDTRSFTEPGNNALVCIRAGAFKPAVYCIHAQSGHLRLYDNLAAHLPADRPVYGLRAAPGAAPPQSGERSLEDLAARYAREIVASQPAGPYLIVGECDGGELAFEVAHQLRADGRDVPLLTLVDSFGPRGPRLRPSIPRLAYRVVDGLRMLGFHARTVARLPSGKRSEYVRTRLIRAITKVAMKVSADRGPRAAAALRQKAFRMALQDYRARPYPGRILLLRGEKLPWGLEPSPHLGWADVAPMLEMELLPAYFGTNMLEPHVRVVAQRLEQAIDAATSAQVQTVRGR